MADHPRLLDLFCGAGGCSEGYYRAGFDPVGIDLHPQPRYPFQFIRADAIQILRDHGDWIRQHFMAIHASPPCQRYTVLRSVFDATRYADLVAPVRAGLQRLGLPYVIENVVGAPLRQDLLLCAAAFGLRSYRHRIFEASFPLVQPDHPPHRIPVNRRKKNRRGHWDAGGFVTVVGDIGSYVGPEAMGIDWMTGAELSQAIPPDYTEYVGRHLLTHLRAVAA